MHPAAASGRGPSPWQGRASAVGLRVRPRTRAECLLAVVVGWRHRRAARPHRTALAALAVPAVAALAANRLAEIPLPL